MTDPSSHLARRLAGEIADLRAQVKILQSQSLLTNAALDDGSIRVTDREGRITQVLGRQGDGSFGSVVRNSPPQGRPMPPVLTAGELGTVQVTWDGGLAFGTLHQAHGHVEVFAAPGDPSAPPSPESARLMGTIRDRAGGSTIIACPQPGTWWVWLRMVGADRETRGDFSEPSSVEVTAVFDEADFEERLQRFTDGELSDAAYGSLMARMGEFLLVRAGQIEANAIDGMVITGGTVQTHHEADRGTKMLPNGLRAWNAAGDQTVRVDGVDNMLMGRIHAGMVEGAGITLDYGEQVINIGTDSEGEPDQTITWVAPFIEMETSGAYDRRPTITVDPSHGGMRIFPGSPAGTPRFRGRLSISGDIAPNQVDARSRLISPDGFRVNTGTTSQPGGIMRDATRTRVQGRLPDTHGPHDMILCGSTSDVTLSPGTGSRGTVVFDAPAPTGYRHTTAWGHVANTALGWDNNRSISVSTAATSPSSFRYTRRADSSNGGDVQSWVYYIAHWA